MVKNHCNQEEQRFASSRKLLNERLEHTNYNDLKRLSNHVERMKISYKDKGICEYCKTNKSELETVLAQLRYSKLFPRRFWVQLCVSPEKFKYASGFGDGFSRIIEVNFIRSRDEVLVILKQFCLCVK